MERIVLGSAWDRGLVGELHDFIGRDMDAGPDEGRFNALALRCFELQYRNIEVYRRLCDKRGARPGALEWWRDIPAVPTDAFRHFDLFCFEPDDVARTFSTSGTSGQARGRASFDRAGLELMKASIDRNAEAHLFPEGRTTRLLVLAPPPRLAPAMIMAWGMNRLIERFGLPGSRFCMGQQGFDPGALADELRRAEKEEKAVTLIGASFGFVNFLDFCEAKRISFELPVGSRIMDAGGYKGKSREVPREELVERMTLGFGIPGHHCVNLLGMTELASQFYDNVLRNAGLSSGEARFKVNPPWTRTMVVDPATLDPAEPGAVGLLRHVDLANRERPSVIQADDFGRSVGSGFEVIGRAADDGSRGCSITIDEIVQGR